jgi:exodeoxyribonuclease VIII
MRFQVYMTIAVIIVLVVYFLWRRGIGAPPEKQKTRLHLMVDLETCSLAPNAYIRSIGACFFDVNGVGSQFYESCDGPDQPGSDVDPETVKWWENQTLEARNALKNDKHINLEVTLHNFHHWVAEEMKVYSLKGDRSDVEVWLWGNGGDFDPVILSNAYKRCKIEQPWQWYNTRCYRTLKNIFKNIRPENFEGEKHNALADAVHQARHASSILRHVYY